MNFTSASSPDRPKVTITFETEGSGYIIAERGVVQSLAASFDGANVVVQTPRAINDTQNALYCCEFVALQQDLHQAVDRWIGTSRKLVSFEYKTSTGNVVAGFCPARRSIISENGTHKLFASPSQAV